MTHSLDPSYWALIGFKDESGLGRMSGDFRALFPETLFLVVPSKRMKGNELVEGEVRLDPGCSEDELQTLLQGLQGIIFFEHIPHEALLKVAASMGIVRVCVPMWEWFNPAVKDWKLCSRFFCPNRHCGRILNKLGFKNTTQITWPVQYRVLPHREIRGAARVFVHNAGMVEGDDRKGTRLAIEAFEQLPQSDLRLIVRSQNELPFPVRDSRIEVRQGNLTHHGELYEEGDVVIQVSKAEGLGFGILEALASGMPVITTDYSPMNEYGSDRSLLIGTHWGKRPAIQSVYIPQAHFKLPKLSSLVKKLGWCARNDVGPISRANRLWAEKTFDETRLRQEWMNKLELLVK